MKILLALLAIAITAGIVAPIKQRSVENNHPSDRRVFGHHPCGLPIYSVYQVFSHDHWGNPIGQWVIQNEGHELCPACLEDKLAKSRSISALSSY